jgi:hypothetical protein
MIILSFLEKKCQFFNRINAAYAKINQHFIRNFETSNGTNYDTLYS